jgi:transcriptional regulator with XRE-family HTH domain
MDKPNLLRIEKGRVNTSIYILNKIAEALGISLEELFKGL